MVARKGRPPRDRRTLLNGIFWILQTGAPWRDLPERLGRWQTVYQHFAKWRREGIFAEIVDALQIRLDDRGLIEWDLWDAAAERTSVPRVLLPALTKKSRVAPR